MVAGARGGHRSLVPAGPRLDSHLGVAREDSAAKDSPVLPLYLCLHSLLRCRRIRISDRLPRSIIDCGGGDPLCRAGVGVAWRMGTGARRGVGLPGRIAWHAGGSLTTVV